MALLSGQPVFQMSPTCIHLSRMYTRTALLEVFLDEEPALNGGLCNSFPSRDVCFQWLSLMQV